MVPIRDSIQDERRTHTEIKRWKMLFHANRNNKSGGSNAPIT